MVLSTFKSKALIKNIYILFLFFLFLQIGFSQNPDVKKVLIDGEKAFQENNFELAKSIFTEALKLDSKNKDFYYNLGASELELGENDNACEHFYQAYLLND